MIDRPVLDMESVVAKIPLALDRFSLLGLSPSVMDVHLVPPCDSLQPDGLRSCEEDSQICLSFRTQPASWPSTTTLPSSASLTVLSSTTSSIDEFSKALLPRSSSERLFSRAILRKRTPAETCRSRSACAILAA